MKTKSVLTHPHSYVYRISEKIHKKVNSGNFGELSQWVWSER